MAVKKKNSEATHEKNEKEFDAAEAGGSAGLKALKIKKNLEWLNNNPPLDIQVVPQGKQGRNFKKGKGGAW